MGTYEILKTDILTNKLTGKEAKKYRQIYEQYEQTNNPKLIN